MSVTVTTSSYRTVAFDIEKGDVIAALEWIDESDAILAEKLRSAGFTNVKVESKSAMDLGRP